MEYRVHKKLSCTITSELVYTKVVASLRIFNTPFQTEYVSFRHTKGPATIQNIFYIQILDL